MSDSSSPTRNITYPWQNTSKSSTPWKSMCIALVSIFLVFQLYWFVPASDQPSTNSSVSEATQICALEASIPERLNLTLPISYGRLLVDVVDDKGSKETTRSRELAVQLPVLQTLSEINGTLNGRRSCTQVTAIKMPRVQRQDQFQGSKVVFAVLTTLERLEDSLQTFAHWAGHTGTTIFCALDAGSDEQIEKVIETASQLGFRLDVYVHDLPEDSSDGDTHFALTKYVYERRQRWPAEWVAFIDDDTFFFDMRSVLQLLDEYDSSKPQYVGGLTEARDRLSSVGYYAYGGAGFFISMPLLGEINEHYDECWATQRNGGDKRIGLCIYAHTTTKLSVEYGLHQVDIMGDPSGFYEANRAQPLSMHHWKINQYLGDVRYVNMVGLSAVSSICGPQCLLQRFHFADDWYLVNGYSIIKYSDDYPVPDIAMEQTWKGDSDLSHTNGPIQEKDTGKISFRLENSVVESDGIVRQFYVRRQRDGDSVIEVAWRRQ